MRICFATVQRYRSFEVTNASHSRISGVVSICSTSKVLQRHASVYTVSKLDAQHSRPSCRNFNRWIQESFVALNFAAVYSTTGCGVHRVRSPHRVPSLVLGARKNGPPFLEWACHLQELMAQMDVTSQKKVKNAQVRALDRSNALLGRGSLQAGRGLRLVV